MDKDGFEQILTNFEKIKKTLTDEIIPKIPNPIKTSSNINPGLSEVITMCVNDFYTLLGQLSILFDLFLSKSSHKNDQIKALLTQKLYKYISPLYTLAVGFNKVNLVTQRQIFNFQKSILSNTMGTSTQIHELHAELQAKDDEITDLNNEINKIEKEKEHNNEKVLFLEKLEGELNQNRNNLEEKVDKLHKEIDELKRNQKVEIDKLKIENEQFQKNYENEAEKLLIQSENLKTNQESEIEKLKKNQEIEIKKIKAEKVSLEARVNEVEIELEALRRDHEDAEGDLRRSQLAIKEAQSLTLQAVSGDDSALQAETIKQVIAILQTQKIWLGMQLGVSRDLTLQKAYIASLPPEQITNQLGGVVPNNFIRVLDISPESVASKCGLAVNDIIVSFNGVLISNVKQIHSIAIDITPGDRIAIVVLRPNGTEYKLLVLGMETRSRMLTSQQLGLLRSLHRGDTLPTRQILEQVMELKAICQSDSSVVTGGHGPMVTRRGSFPHLSQELSSYGDSLRDSFKDSNSKRD
jgi:hypothetical protein